MKKDSAGAIALVMPFPFLFAGAALAEADPANAGEYAADATACCAQGIESVWKGEHRYPRDCPPLDTEITVTGIFSTYYEGDNLYVQLADADARWQ